MLQIKNDNVLIPVTLWNELKDDLYFRELIEALEDRQELIEAGNEAEVFFDFNEYDAQRMARIKNV